MKLYDFQVQVAELIQAGKNVILQAPTGAGKTMAALWPYLEAWDRNDPIAFPRKCIYSVPMKVLANQFSHDIDKIVKEKMVLGELPNITVQTGDRPEDRKFQGDLIFTTIDQTLSSFLNIPYGLGTRLANLNAGAVMSSYLVFDELHLYDPDTTLPTTLEMLKMLKGITPFIVMTATFSSSMLQDLADLLDAVVVPDPGKPEERLAMEKIGSQVGKDRRFYAQPGPLTAEAVLAHEAKRTICICNTVKSAQDLYDDLKTSLQQQRDTETELRLLHGRFYKTDRGDKERWLRKHFDTPNYEYTGRRLIQIATQVIEVGVDATCDVLHTELSPASSLLQRAGRCARRENEKGAVFIYLPRDENDEPYYAPYGFGERGKQLCEATWTAVNTPKFTDTHMSFRMEQALIDAVHTPIDQAIMQEIGQISYNRREKMLSVMRNPIEGRGLSSELIRNVDNRFVFVHSQPQLDEKLLTNPWAYDGFGLYPGMIAKAFKELEADGLMWGAKAVKDDDAPARQKTQYKWYPLGKGNEARYTPVIAVHPEIITYDEERGFRFAWSDGKHKAPLRKKTRDWERYGYRRETYAEHVAGLYAAYQDGRADFPPLKDEIAFVVNRLENELPRFQLQPGQIDEMLRTMFACHDLGKLDVKWQKWAHEWQKRAGQFYGEDMRLPQDYMAAHTDYDPNDEKQREAQKSIRPKRPNHAGESGMAAATLFYELCGENNALWRAVETAIFRHHTATANSYESYRLNPSADHAILEALNVVNCPTSWSKRIETQMPAGEPLGKLLIDFDNRSLEEVLLYFLLVRVLRLADQRSQAR